MCEYSHLNNYIVYMKAHIKCVHACLDEKDVCDPFFKVILFIYLRSNLYCY